MIKFFQGIFSKQPLLEDSSTRSQSNGETSDAERIHSSKQGSTSKANPTSPMGKNPVAAIPPATSTSPVATTLPSEKRDSYMNTLPGLRGVPGGAFKLKPLPLQAAADAQMDELEHQLVSFNCTPKGRDDGSCSASDEAQHKSSHKLGSVETSIESLLSPSNRISQLPSLPSHSGGQPEGEIKTLDSVKPNVQWAYSSSHLIDGNDEEQRPAASPEDEEPAEGSETIVDQITKFVQTHREATAAARPNSYRPNGKVQAARDIVEVDDIGVEDF